ncbi:hypothetical protein N799_12685 [Lysobacter arseniciresistens ZS79]|uniref:Lipoprotein n=1 Tax=Lysobacter arseniciresistens ZS79 TaxID=913325 RepID=A0A0A0F3B8_9GAMM|nr:hypothetical protein [Lysobacter arseniciresistens]KGM57045.1 hypothetical protein N799_12685 [Lysobacter arseniciresistens ZS79]
MKYILAAMLAVTASGCVVIPEDLLGRFGGGTVLVCHKGKKTMELPREALNGHLNHGDHRGPC